MRTLYKGIFGSHLYGTSTPTSDQDFKGIAVPNKSDILLQRVRKSVQENTKTSSDHKNSADDVDCEIYALHYFIPLAVSGDIGALDIIHTPKELWLTSSPEWEFIYNNRAKFYSKNIRAFVKYAQMQCGKYGIKGSRIAAAKSVLEQLESFPELEKLGAYWDSLKVSEHVVKIDNDTTVTSQSDKRVYEVCNRKLIATAQIRQCKQTLQAVIKGYGERAKQAEMNQGIDWKAVSHAFRAAYQVKEILMTGDLKFPLQDRDYIMKLKSGALNFKDDGIDQKLTELVQEVSALNETSKFPEHADVTFWENFVLDVYNKEKLN